MTARSENRAVLTLNAGSSSLKVALFPVGADTPLATGLADRIGPDGALALKDAAGTQLPATGDLTTHAGAMAAVIAAFRARWPDLHLAAIGHRVVHGGPDRQAPEIVTDAALADLDRLAPFAPLHQPHNLEGIRQFRAAFPEVPQIACFDTAFHATMPEVDYAFALPQSLQEQGVRRYGFHGLSYQYIMSVLQQQTLRGRGRVVMAHLGNGASLCAALAGCSVATTMGFSALDGLMMGTRSGALDAGVLLYLMEQGWTHAQMEKLLYKQSGLLGVSGISADMRKLRADGSVNAQRAIDQFTHRVIRETGALVACLGGLDVLAFSGGIGENDAVLRANVCERLAWLGIRMDAQRNQQASGKEAYAIHAPDSSVEIWVIPTDEGRVAAREAAALLAQQRTAPAAMQDKALA